MITRVIFLFALSVLSGLPGKVYAADAGQADALPRVRLETNLGNIDFELYPEQAPITVANFLSLVDDGFYDGLIFHRVIAGFMIQAGGFDAQMNYHDEPGTIINESLNGLLNRTQFVAMARLPEPDSAGSQFFINVARNKSLDGRRGRPGYAVFAKVIGGWDVVQEIEQSKTGTKDGMGDVPDTPIVIKQATRLGSAVGGAGIPYDSDAEAEAESSRKDSRTESAPTGAESSRTESAPTGD